MGGLGRPGRQLHDATDPLPTGEPEHRLLQVQVTDVGRVRTHRPAEADREGPTDGDPDRDPRLEGGPGARAALDLGHPRAPQSDPVGELGGGQAEPAPLGAELAAQGGRERGGPYSARSAPGFGFGVRFPAGLAAAAAAAFAPLFLPPPLAFLPPAFPAPAAFRGPAGASRSSSR